MYQSHGTGRPSADRQDLIREHTKAGLAAARARVGGRPKGLTPEAQVKARAVKTMYANKLNTITEIGLLFHISRATVYRYLAWQEVK
ncbi:helix-turn-helix domain-containing protein [Spirosoma fluviale]|uniref:helix-turn-helix domain-containing protein n=1 Tax=Spirosoma fluviale TaxID=1597977 RepID=UPI0021D275D7|nr:helix-turn-helix domain-containing protein [Spirosoma fluviale]